MVRVLGLSDPFMEQTGFLTVNILGKSTTNWNFYQGEEKDIPSSNWTFSVNSFHSWVLTDLILSVIYCDIHQEMMMVMKLTNLARGSKVKLHPWVSDGGWLLDNLRPGVSLWPSSLLYQTKPNQTLQSIYHCWPSSLPFTQRYHPSGYQWLLNNMYQKVLQLPLQSVAQWNTSSTTVALQKSVIR